MRPRHERGDDTTRAITYEIKKKKRKKQIIKRIHETPKLSLRASFVKRLFKFEGQSNQNRVHPFRSRTGRASLYTVVYRLLYSIVGVVDAPFHLRETILVTPMAKTSVHPYSYDALSEWSKCFAALDSSGPRPNAGQEVI